MKSVGQVAGLKRKRTTEPKHYAVRIGYAPGVYDTWAQCKAQVTGFRGAIFKAFPSADEARRFVAGQDPTKDAASGSYQTKYYAIARGVKPGIYTDWTSAQRQIVGSTRPRHRAFSTRAEAEAFMLEHRSAAVPELTVTDPPSKGRSAIEAKKRLREESVEDDDAEREVLHRRKRSRPENAAEPASGNFPPLRPSLSDPGFKIPIPPSPFYQYSKTTPSPSATSDPSFLPPPRHPTLWMDMGPSTGSSYGSNPSPIGSSHLASSNTVTPPSLTESPLPPITPPYPAPAHDALHGLNRPIPRSVGQATDSSSPLTVFTDGSALGSRQSGYRAGIGVFFGNGDPRNISAPLQEPGDKQTNNRAELTAILRAIEAVPISTALNIHSDSQYSISCITEWSAAWARKGWRNSSGGDVLNQDLIKAILAKIEERRAAKTSTYFTWVKGHAKSTGNIEADRLAIAAAKSITKRTQTAGTEGAVGVPSLLEGGLSGQRPSPAITGRPDPITEESEEPRRMSSEEISEQIREEEGNRRRHLATAKERSRSPTIPKIYSAEERVKVVPWDDEIGAIGGRD